MVLHVGVCPIVTIKDSLITDALAKFIVGENYNSTIDLELIPDIEFNIGSNSSCETTGLGIDATLTVNDIEYRIISIDTENGTIDLMSTSGLGSVTLGKNDPIAIENATDLDNDEVVSDAEKALYSYNNAVTTIVMACVDESGIETVDGKNVISIRTVGNRNIKYTSSGLVGDDSALWSVDDFNANNDANFNPPDWFRY